MLFYLPVLMICTCVHFIVWQVFFRDLLYIGPRYRGSKDFDFFVSVKLFDFVMYSLCRLQQGSKTNGVI
jgi:hypothetical protein